MMNQVIQNNKLQLLVIFLATFIVFSNIFQNEFLLDDETFIKNWETSQNFEITKLLTGNLPEVHKGVYRPIRSLLYSIYYQIWQDNDFGYHLHSLFVHLVSTILVFLIIARILKDSFVGFIAGVLFGLHPIHTEAITYIAASMEITGATFFFASFYFYLKGKNKSSFYLLSILFAGLAFFTYEMTLTLPVLIILYEFLLGKRELSREKRIKNYIPYFILAVFYFLVRFTIGVGISRGDYLGYSFYHTQLAMMKVWVKYIWLLINPTQISYIHNIEESFESFMTHHSRLQSILSQSIFDLDIMASILILLGLVFTVVKFWKKQPVLSFAILWFFISLVPVAYIFPQGIALAEKYLYIASFGFVLLLGYFFIRLQDWLPAKKPLRTELLLLTFVLIALIYGYLTYQRNQDWHDPITFWSKVVKQHPKSALGYYTLGVFYTQNGRIDQAERAYKKTIKLDPLFYEAYHNLANIYEGSGREVLAYDYYKQALGVKPDFIPSQGGLKRLISHIGQWRKYIVQNGYFLAPEEWRLEQKGEWIILSAPNGGLTIQMKFTALQDTIREQYLASAEKYGELENFGKAKIPNIDEAFVKKWKQGQVQKLQFFLFQNRKVVEVIVFPPDSELMPMFDQILSSININ